MSLNADENGKEFRKDFQKSEKKVSKDKNMNQPLFSRIEDSGIKYILEQKHYLLISGIFPLIIMVIQILNIYFILQPSPLPPEGVPSPIYPPKNESIIPVIVFLLFAAFAILKFLYQFEWKKQINLYKTLQLTNQIGKNVTEDYKRKGQHSLTNLFYKIIYQMEKVKWIFYLLNLIFIVSLQWFIVFFFGEFGEQTPPNAPMSAEIMQIINLIGHILLLIYLYLEWKHFKKWNKKLNQLKIFELKIYHEVEIEEPLD